MIPGSNLFNRAARLIRTTEVTYYMASGRVKNAAFQWISNFVKLPPLYASVQPIQRDMYAEFGLDFQKQYVKVWASHNVIDIERDTAGDRFIYKGRLFQIESKYTWWHEDGWDKCIAVDIGKPVDGGPGA